VLAHSAAAALPQNATLDIEQLLNPLFLIDQE
jgi:hypothetical protein